MNVRVTTIAVLAACTAVGATCVIAQPAVRDTSLASLRRIAVQHKGRIKPLDAMARETVYHLTGASRFHGADPMRTLFDMVVDPSQAQDLQVISLPYRPVRERLAYAVDQKFVSYAELVETRTLMRNLPAIMKKQEQDRQLSITELEVLDVFNRFVTFSGVISHDIAMVPASPGQRLWLSFKGLDVDPTVQNQWQALLDAYAKEDSTALMATSQALVSTLRAKNPAAYPAGWRLSLECWYYFIQPFHWALVLYLLSCATLLVGMLKQQPAMRMLGHAALWYALLWHVIGLGMRVILSGHPPVTNFFETMLWLPLVGVIVGLILQRRTGGAYFALAATVIASIALGLTDYVPLDPHIVPVVAVLRSNKWLLIHVLTIVASYGVLALATALAHIYSVVYIRDTRASMLSDLDQYTYRAIQVGVVLLTAGIMLGGVWANASWGRYWGWDPKETWALITLLAFLALLHGRIVGWCRGVGTAIGTMIGFLLLLVTYYGVSFYMVGLHSYAGGNAKPLPWILVAYVIVETCFIGLMLWRSRQVRT